MIQIDMKKPNHCLHCPMCNGDDDCVLIQEIDTSWDWEEQYANCPLQEVKPERKKGKWIADVDRWGDVVTTVNGYICSECKVFNTDKDNYCPNCGADMRGDSDE